MLATYQSILLTVLLTIMTGGSCILMYLYVSEVLHALKEHKAEKASKE